jgi:hypothetical protein
MSRAWRSTATIESYVDIVAAGGGTTSFVELYADQAIRIDRNETPLRLDRKRSKRDVEFSRRNLVELDAGYVLNTGGSHRTVAQRVLDRHAYVRIDNTHLSAADAAAAIAARLQLRESPTC